MSKIVIYRSTAPFWRGRKMIVTVDDRQAMTLRRNRSAEHEIDAGRHSVSVRIGNSVSNVFVFDVAGRETRSLVVRPTSLTVEDAWQNLANSKVPRLTINEGDSSEFAGFGMSDVVPRSRSGLPAASGLLLLIAIALGRFVDQTVGIVVAALGLSFVLLTLLIRRNTSGSPPDSHTDGG